LSISPFKFFQRSELMKVSLHHVFKKDSLLFKTFTLSIFSKNNFLFLSR